MEISLVHFMQSLDLYSVVHFHKGAFLGGFPVQPVVIKYIYHNFCPSWETIPIHIQLFRFLTEITHSLEVMYLPAYFPTEEEQQNAQLYADNVQKVNTLQWLKQVR